MIRLLFRLVANFFRLLFSPLFLWRRTRTLPKGTYVHLEIDGAVSDVASPGPWWRLRRKAAVTLYGVARLIDELIADPAAPGLLVTLRGFHSGMASATSLRAQLARLRDAGRDVVVHLPLGAGSKELYVATAGSRIFVGPTTSVAPLGFAVNTRYVRGTLDKVGVVPEVLARGRYKSAGESLMRESMSEAQREQLGALLETCYEELVRGIAEGRRVTEVRARAFIDEAPHRGAVAVRDGLVDGEAYEDEIPTKLGTEATPAKLLPAALYLATRTAKLLRPLRVPPHVGVIRVHGPIALAGGSPLPLATDDIVIQLARRARKDPRVRGVILHIDSPGGSALASDRMHHELARLAADKPLVACMANVAASGGYYVAAPAHVIVAEPTTITGSIGVVAARFSPAPLLARIGVATETVSFGANASLLDPVAQLGERETRALESEIEGIYDAFVQVVADGRNKTLDEVRAVAEGRVWTGKDAAARGLVDRLGGFDVALAAVRERLGAGAQELEPVVIVPPRTAIAPFAARARRERRVARVVGDLLGQWTALLPGGIAQLVVAGSRERVLAWLDLSML